jgi:hypothetical protein
MTVYARLVGLVGDEIACAQVSDYSRAIAGHRQPIRAASFRGAPRARTIDVRGAVQDESWSSPGFHAHLGPRALHTDDRDAFTTSF